MSVISPVQGADGRERFFQHGMVRSRLRFPDSLFAINQLAAGGTRSPAARCRPAPPAPIVRRPRSAAALCRPAAPAAPGPRMRGAARGVRPHSPTGPRLIGTAEAAGE